MQAVAAVFAVVLAGALEARAQTPLDLSDPTPREVRVRFETSADLAVVGQGYGPGWPAAWSVSGSTGRVEVDAETHAEIRQVLSLPPLPGFFTPFVVEIDRVTHAVTSPPATGGYSDGTISFGFATAALDSAATGGFVGPDTQPLYCTSQQQVDDACPFFPLVCGQTCTIVPGSAYDPATGKLNLIGSEEQQGCDGGACFGPVVLFAKQGDLRLLEAVEPVPAGALWQAVVLAALLLLLCREAFRSAPPGRL